MNITLDKIDKDSGEESDDNSVDSPRLGLLKRENSMRNRFLALKELSDDEDDEDNNNIKPSNDINIINNSNKQTEANIIRDEDHNDPTYNPILNNEQPQNE